MSKFPTPLILTTLVEKPSDKITQLYLTALPPEEIKLNKQRLLDFDVTLNYRGEAQKRVKLRPTDDNEYKALIKSFTLYEKTELFS